MGSGDETSSVIGRFRAVDLVHSAGLGAFAVLGLLAGSQSASVLWLVALNIVLIMAIAGLAAGPFSGFGRRRTAVSRLIMSVVIIPVAFSELAAIIPAVNRLRYDEQLRHFDRTFLQFDPESSMIFLHHPILSELFSTVYFSFYLMPIALFGVFYRRQMYGAIAAANTAIVIGFYLSYAGNVLIPAASPFRTVPFEADLPSFWLHEPLNYLVKNYEIHELSAFPSGHILVAAIVASLCARWQLRETPLFLLWGLLLWLGTLYLGYHYLIDTLVALPLAPLCIWAGFSISRRFDRPTRGPTRG